MRGVTRRRVFRSHQLFHQMLEPHLGRLLRMVLWYASRCRLARIHQILHQRLQPGQRRLLGVDRVPDAVEVIVRHVVGQGRLFSGQWLASSSATMLGSTKR